MKNSFLLLRALLICAVVLWLSGCGRSPTARFYTLTPLSPKATQPAPSASPVSVSIAPVEIPDYLDRPQIVTRDGQNELKLAEFERWGGSLSENMSAVLAENIGQLLGSDRVYAYPRLRPEQADFSVAMRVLRLDCTVGGQVFFKAQWSLFSADKKEVATRMSTFTERLSDKKYETIVAAVDRTLEQASREIVKEISAARASRPEEQAGKK